MNGEVETIRGLLGAVGAALDELAPRDAAGLELLALNLVAPFVDPDLADEAAALLPAALEERGDALAAGVLAALAELAPGPGGLAAAAACERLAQIGVVSPLRGAVGTLRPVECHRLVLAEGDAEMIGVLLRRPGKRKAQAAVVFLEHHACGGVIVRGLLAGPERPAAVRDLLGAPHPELLAEPVGADRLAETLAGALAHMVEHEIELPLDVLPPLLVLRRAFRAGWVLPRLGQSAELLDLLREDADELANAFAAEHGDEAAGVADAMCHWRVEYVGGLVERWTVADVHEFLLDWYPRKGGAGEPVESVPRHVVAFLRFLDTRGRLEGDSLETLEREVASLRATFERAARDRGNWGLAKAAVMQMRAEGVDPMDEASVARWAADFNARALSERERVLRPSLPRAAQQQRKLQRRSAKAARRRNRR